MSPPCTRPTDLILLLCTWVADISFYPRSVVRGGGLVVSGGRPEKSSHRFPPTFSPSWKHSLVELNF